MDTPASGVVQANGSDSSKYVSTGPSVSRGPVQNPLTAISSTGLIGMCSVPVPELCYYVTNIVHYGG